MDEINQILKHHYEGRELREQRVDAILDACEPARQIHHWKRLALVGFATAAAATVAFLLAVTGMMTEQVEAPPIVDNQTIPLKDLAQPKRFQLIAVKIHADPCGRCHKIAPIFADLQNEFTDDPVLFLTFDLTSKGSRRQAENISKVFGIEEVFKKHRYTGVIVLTTPSGDIKAIVDSEADIAAATKAVTQNLISG